MIIFYDAQCPLCNAEMMKLKEFDSKQRIELVDIHSKDLNLSYPKINKEYAMGLLHGINDDCEMIYGLDVTYQSWQAVGKYPWLKVLRLPVIKFFADIGYRFFAKHRQQISRLFMRHDICEKDQCTAKRKNL